MIPSNFDYVAPATVDDAVAALAQAGQDAKIIAGGQSLMPVLRLRLAAPTVLVDLGKIDELRGVRDDGESILIGAMTTYYNLLGNPLVSRHALLLADATRTVADPQIRHRGTLGGAVSHADPAGDLCAPVLALGATMTAAGPSGRRSIPASEFFVDYFTTALHPDEILTEIRIPKHTDWTAHYEKLNRVAQAWSIVAVAATVAVDGGVIRQASVALTNMASVPVRARGVEDALIGQEASPELIRAAAEHAAEGTRPNSDGNADADYRSHLAKVLTRRAVATAIGV
jgi:aerobic carbon-monoxide dehydrogenase medium subunit